MTNKIVPIILALALSLQGMTGFAQGKSIYSKDFQAKVEKDINEFAKNAPQYTTGAYYKDYADRISRVEIKTRPISPGEPYTLLSTVILLNKYNPELKRDNAQNFNPETFNPLKYNFAFFAKTDQIYRVDGTNYIIVIHPQQP